MEGQKHHNIPSKAGHLCRLSITSLEQGLLERSKGVEDAGRRYWEKYKWSRKKEKVVETKKEMS